MFVFIAPVVITEDKEAGGDLREGFQDFHCGRQQFWLVDQVAGKDNCVAVELHGLFDHKSIEIGAGTIDKVKVREMDQVARGDALLHRVLASESS